VVRKYRKRGVPGPQVEVGRLEDVKRSVGGTPVKRTNAYSIVSAAIPTSTISAPVDQDGTDFSYFTPVKFGASGTTLLMLIDTGSADTWVMGDKCTTDVCNAHTTFGSSDSTTFVEQASNKWDVAYGTGSVSGTIATDSAAFAGFNIPLQFGVADTVSDDFADYPIDGILGLGQPKSSSENVPTLMETLVTKGLIKANIFGIHISRTNDGANGGVITFGDVDTTHFDGALTYTDVTSSQQLWEIPVDDAGLGTASSKPVSKTAIIDTGTSMMLLPPNDAKALHALFPSMQQSGENFQIPCDSTVSLYITFGGTPFEISPADYLGPATTNGMCSSNIIGRVSSSAPW
jgi:cathepsin D